MVGNMKIEDTRVYGFEMALYGMRNPHDSWDDSDSVFFINQNTDIGVIEYIPIPHLTSSYVFTPEYPRIGPKDLELATMLIKRGTEHCKFLRQIMIWVNITIPRYVWQELDTYKIGTTRMSCSTMHTLGFRDLEQSDFNHPISEADRQNINILGCILREAKTEGGGVKEARVQLKNDLSEGFLQKATYTMSYQTALSMLLQRGSHRLPEWNLKSDGSICQWLMSLPYMNEFYEAATFKRRQLKDVSSKLLYWIKNADDSTVSIGAATLRRLRDQIESAM